VEIIMGEDDCIENAVTGGKVSRRSVLRGAASFTAGVVAAGTVNLTASDAQPEIPETVVAPDHDPLTGEIFDRDRHHRWDTI
jgi:hypothetical protein